MLRDFYGLSGYVPAISMALFGSSVTASSAPRCATVDDFDLEHAEFVAVCEVAWDCSDLRLCKISLMT
jgi:hypothetical protein